MSNPDAMVSGISGGGSLSDLLGKVDNLNDPVPVLNKRSVAYGLVLFLLILANASAILRLYVRLYVTRCPGWDDLFIGFSMLTGTLLSVSVLVGYDYHFGEHFLLFAADVDEIVKYTKAAYVPNATYPTATSLVKIAILLQFLRVFEAKSRYRTATIIMLFITSLWGLAFSFISWFPAFPVSAFWDLTNQTAIRYGVASLTADEFTGTLIALNATNMALDMVMLGIPVPYYLRSSLAWKSRLSLLGLFILGSVINAISLARLAVVVDSQAGTYPTFDPTFYGTSQLVLTSLEVSLAIVAASLPVFWPMVNFSWGSIFVTTEITIHHQNGNDVISGARSYISSWDVKMESREKEENTILSVTDQNEEACEEEKVLVIEPLPDFKTWKAAREVEDTLVITPLPDFRTWKAARDDRDSASLYASTIC